MERVKCVFFVEGSSDKALLEGLLPRLRKDLLFQIKSFDGKGDLKKNVATRIQNWSEPNTSFVVLADKDGEDCKKLKRDILDMCQRAAHGKSNQIKVRIACAEIESWFLGDLSALGQAFKKPDLAKLGLAKK